MFDLPTKPCPKLGGTGNRQPREAGAVLRGQRLEKGITAATMARELCVDRRVVYEWECGRILVPQDVPERWARVCREKGSWGAT
jgi:hypothetical protein